jgi:hypothetical protein
LQKENRLNNKKARSYSDLSAHADSSTQLCSICNLNSAFYDVSTGETVCSTVCITFFLVVSNSNAIISGAIPELYRLSIVMLLINPIT